MPTIQITLASHERLKAMRRSIPETKGGRVLESFATVEDRVTRAVSAIRSIATPIPGKEKEFEDFFGGI